MKNVAFLFMGFVLFLIGCGGGGTGARIASPLTGPAADTAIAAEAIDDSPWSSETVSEPTSEKQETANAEIQSLITSVLEEGSAKKERSSTSTINRSIVGSRGGTATVTGTREITSTTGAVYPITTETETNIKWNGYEGERFSIHGETNYTGSTTITSPGNFQTNFTTNGGYSYKDNDGVYSFATQMDVSLVSVDYVISGTYTYVVNGKTYSGSF